jgi:prepilin-type N-terminal cleavage/methylation domain-containing protein
MNNKGHSVNSGLDDQKGFSLIELMIAAVVLTIGLISVVGISAYVSRTNSTSNTMNVVVANAQAESDKLRNLSWSQVAEDSKLTVGGALDYYTSDNNHREQILDTAVGTLNACWQVADGPGTTGDVRTVTLRVVQENAPARLAEGVTITMMISKK